MADMINRAWWDSIREKEDGPVDQRASDMHALIQSITEDQGYLREADRRHMRYYRNLAMFGFSPWSSGRIELRAGPPMSLNVVRSMVNTVNSRICKSRPKTTVFTTGGSRAMRKKAKNLDRFLSGAFYSCNVYRTTPAAQRDSLIFGTGFVYVTETASGIEVERVFPPEMRVDSVEGAHRCPRSIYRVRWVDRRVLQKRYPESATALEGVESNPLDDPWDTLIDSETVGPTNDSTSDLVRVEEGWHLESSPGSGDGLHAVTCEGILLAEEPWNYDWFPFAVIRWSEPPIGYWGMGLAEELAGIQIEINRLLRRIQQAMDMLANPYILASRAAQLAKGSWSDLPGSVVEYSGPQMPQVITPQTVSPEVFAHLDRLYQRAYEIAGVSQANAQAAPIPYQSGRARLVSEDVQSDRFAEQSRSWDQLHMDIADLMIKCGRRKKNWKVKVWGPDSMDVLNFKDVDMKDDEFVLRMWPTALVADSPSGQLDLVDKLVQGGYVGDPVEALEMIDNPDLDAFVRKATSGRRLVEAICDKMLDGGRYIAPSSAMDLNMAAALGQQIILQAMVDEDVDDDDLRKVERFVATCIAMSGQGSPSPGQISQASQGGPPPGAPPTPPAAAAA